MSFRYGIVSLFFLILGLLSLRIPTPREIQKNEALSTIAGTFLLISLTMIIPLMGNDLTMIDAFFEAVSGVTTTGLSVMPTQVGTKTFAFARAVLQWSGGIGIVVFSLGLAMQPGMITKGLGREIANRDDLVSSTRLFARHMLFVYVLLTLLCFLALFTLSPDFFDTLTLALSAISTGGMSATGAGLDSYSTPIQWTVLLFSLLGAVSFPLFLFRNLKSARNFLADIQFLTMLVLIGVCSSLIIFFSGQNLSIKDAILNTLSAQTTAGFVTVPMSEMNSFVKVVLSAAMVIGGSTQSTAGGFKILRLLVLLKGVQLIFLKTSLSKNVAIFPKIAGQKLTFEEKDTCFSIIILFLFSVFISWLFFIAAGYAPLDSLFEIFSAIGTVGLSSGITNTELPSHLKLVLCINMFLGRLEFITFLTLFLPKTWIGRRRMF